MKGFETRPWRRHCGAGIIAKGRATCQKKVDGLLAAVCENIDIKLGNDWTLPIAGGTLTQSCQADGSTRLKALVCQGPLYVKETERSCAPRPCGSRPHLSVWNEKIEHGSRDLVCNFGNVSVTAGACDINWKWAGETCQTWISCDQGIHKPGDVWYEFSSDACWRYQTEITCKADGGLTRVREPIQNLCPSGRPGLPVETPIDFF